MAADGCGTHAIYLLVSLGAGQNLPRCSDCAFTTAVLYRRCRQVHRIQCRNGHRTVCHDEHPLRATARHDRQSCGHGRSRPNRFRGGWIHSNARAQGTGSILQSLFSVHERVAGQALGHGRPVAQQHCGHQRVGAGQFCTEHGLASNRSGYQCRHHPVAGFWHCCPCWARCRWHRTVCCSPWG